MRPTTLDPFLFFKIKNAKEIWSCSKLEGLQGTQVDCTVGTGDICFEDLKEEESKSFEGNPRVSKISFRFSRSWISKKNDSTGT